MEDPWAPVPSGTRGTARKKPMTVMMITARAFLIGTRLLWIAWSKAAKCFHSQHGSQTFPVPDSIALRRLLKDAAIHKTRQHIEIVPVGHAQIGGGLCVLFPIDAVRCCLEDELRQPRLQRIGLALCRLLRVLHKAPALHDAQLT